MEVKNKRIIVTGAASGIGKELTKQLLEKGAYITGLDINIDALKDLEKEFNSKKLSTYVVDMSDQESIIKFKNKYTEKVDILINNAGIIQPFVSVEELDNDVINRVMNVNFFGPVTLTRLFIPELKNNKESYIVNISSMGGFFPFPKQSIYGASKAAIKIFTEGLYAELSNTSVKVMVVFPGAVETNITKNSRLQMKSTPEKSSYKVLPAPEAAKTIIEGIEKNKFKLFVGSDSKFMKLLYKLNSKKAIDMINKKMNNF